MLRSPARTRGKAVIARQLLLHINIALIEKTKYIEPYLSQHIYIKLKRIVDTDRADLLVSPNLVNSLQIGKFVLYGGDLCLTLSRDCVAAAARFCGSTDTSNKYIYKYIGL